MSDLLKIIGKYDEYVKISSMQEDIRIVSSKMLDEGERKHMEELLLKGCPGVQVEVGHEVDSLIMAGLQVCSGSTFLGCSLR